PEAGLTDGARGRGCRADPHDGGIASDDSPTDEARDRIEALLLGPRGVGDDHARRAVADSRRVARGDEAVLLEVGRELRERGGVRRTRLLVDLEGHVALLLLHHPGDEFVLALSRPV